MRGAWPGGSAIAADGRQRKLAGSHSSRQNSGVSDDRTLPRMRGWLPLLTALLQLALLAGCTAPRPGAPLKRTGDEIIVAGQLFHTGTRVVTWMDPAGYDAYRTERRFAAFDQSSWETSKVAVAALKTPNRFGLRKEGLTEAQVEIGRAHV